jgi:4-alpha-glucanotransferase
MHFTRSSGILMHITSLPSRHGIGDLGIEAYRFADFLAKAKQTYWQILPLTPIEEGLGNSPYSSLSAFAGNTLLISLDKLCQEGLLETSDIENIPEAFGDTQKVHYQEVRNYKLPILIKAAENFLLIKDKQLQSDFEEFCKSEAHWLHDFALFKALKEYFENKQWIEWDEKLVNHDKETIADFEEKLAKPIQQEKFLQYIFSKQWHELKNHCHLQGIKFFGDMPIYVNYDSVDVWTNHQFFKLDENKKPMAVAGTPPDYFAADGQLWGNPVYNWQALEKDNFNWWLKRLAHNIKLFDLVRLDHFLGFINYYEIPAGDETAKNGTWVNAPAEAFFEAVKQAFPGLPIIAEDLGTLSPAVIDFLNRHQLPGMKVLQFAFGDDMQQNPYLPHNHIRNTVVYTATHDNNTSKGWWQTEARDSEKSNFGNYADIWIDDNNVSDELCRMAMYSVADICILPIQDILGLDASARMNIPGVGEGNWTWRLDGRWLNDWSLHKLRTLTQISSRTSNES